MRFLKTNSATNFKSLCSVVIILSFLFFPKVHPKDFSEYDVKAVYLYNFVDFMTWPTDDRVTSKTICVFGPNPFKRTLDNLAKSKNPINGIVIEYLQKLKNINDCHILFVSKAEEKRFSEIIKLVEEQSVLMVSDIPKFVYKGGMVGLTTDSERIRLEVNLRLVEEHGIKIDSNLLEISTIVDTSGG